MLASALIGLTTATVGPNCLIDFTLIDAWLANAVTAETVVTETPIAGAALLIARDGEIVHLIAVGDFASDTQVRIASATKWMSGATVMTAVDQGLLTLDTPISVHVPSFDTPDKSAITVRQAMSHTAGLPGNVGVIYSPRVDLQGAAAQLGQTPLVYEPGVMFGYGGVSMHAAGAAVEVAAGVPWATYFETHIASPLGLEATAWTVAGGPDNPGIGGGLRSTLDDYYAFLQMIAAGGVNERGEAVLTADAIDAMLSNQSGGPPIFSTPLEGVSDYGVGCWLDNSPVPGAPATIFSSPGAFGFTPWIDTERGLVGIFAVEDTRQNVEGLVAAIRSEINAQIDGCVCPADLNGNGWVGPLDLAVVLGGWGECGAFCPGDLNDDGAVDEADLATLLAAWGACDDG